MDRSLHDTTEVLTALPVATRTNGTDNGTELDLADADAVHIIIPVSVWNDGSHEIQFLHRDDTGDAQVRVPTADLDARVDADLTDDGGNGNVTVGDASYDAKNIQLAYIGGKRHLDVDIVTTGATGGADLGVLVQVSRLRNVGTNPMVPGWTS